MKRDTKKEILDAFDKSEKKTVDDVCRIVGITQPAFYFHFYKDADFHRQVLEKRRDRLNEKIAATA